MRPPQRRPDVVLSLHCLTELQNTRNDGENVSYDECHTPVRRCNTPAQERRDYGGAECSQPDFNRFICDLFFELFAYTEAQT